MFAVCGVAAGVLAKARACRCRWSLVAACAVGAALGAVNGALVAYVAHPVDRRHARDDGRAARRVAVGDQGAWVQDLPADFQWLGLGAAGLSVARRWPWSLPLLAVVGWGLRNLAAGRRFTRPARTRRPRGSPAFDVERGDVGRVHAGGRR